jgi:hypothetical protein
MLMGYWYVVAQVMVTTKTKAIVLFDPGRAAPGSARPGCSALITEYTVGPEAGCDFTHLTIQSSWDYGNLMKRWWHLPLLNAWSKRCNDHLEVAPSTVETATCAANGTEGAIPWDGVPFQGLPLVGTAKILQCVSWGVICYKTREKNRSKTETRHTQKWGQNIEKN